jgi:hypothetical protein
MPDLVSKSENEEGPWGLLTLLVKLLEALQRRAGINTYSEVLSAALFGFHCPQNVYPGIREPVTRNVRGQAFGSVAWLVKPDRMLRFCA